MPKKHTKLTLLKDTIMTEEKKDVVVPAKFEKLVAEIVQSAADELNITLGATIFAAVKASSFRRLV